MDMKKQDWNRQLMAEQYRVAHEKAATSYLHECDQYILQAVDEEDVEIFPMEERFRDRISDDANWLEKYHYFNFDIETFADISSITPEAVQMSELKIPIGIVLGEIHDFFNHLGGEWRNLFNKVYRERTNNLRFSNERSYNFYLPGHDYSYINIQKNDTISIFTDLAHEYGHSIADMMKYRMYDEENDLYPFIELASMFFQFAIGDWLSASREGLDNLVNDERVVMARSCGNYSNYITYLSKYLNALNEKGRKVPTKYADFVRGMVRALNITKPEVKTSFEKSKKEQYIYVVPYLTALELYYIYKEDPKEALRLLKEIIMVEQKRYYNEYLKSLGINLNEHSEEHVKTIMKRYNEFNNKIKKQA